MVAQTRHAGQDSPKNKLKFHEKLIGKGLATDALLKKLKALHTELAALDQDVDVNSLGTIRKELINTSVLLHKDRGVKAYAACCLADILRLYAPDAPYTQSELRDIFQFFFRQLSTGLKGADSSYYNEYFHLLESLSTVKSVVLVCDLPTAEELMVEIFRDFFGLVKRDLAKKIEMFMVDILVALIDECQVLPTEVLETILSQFMDKNTVCPPISCYLIEEDLFGLLQHIYGLAICVRTR
jgi:sister chromatid cohesion protein PDS5